jgi:hypothetical protein
MTGLKCTTILYICWPARRAYASERDLRGKRSLQRFTLLNFPKGTFIPNFLFKLISNCALHIFQTYHSPCLTGQACYKAALRGVGPPMGRRPIGSGWARPKAFKRGHDHLFHGKIKDIYLYPLRKDFRKKLGG